MLFDGRLAYTYDAWNRMVSARTCTARIVDGQATYDAGPEVARYEYDGRGYRVAKQTALHADEANPHITTGYDRTDYHYNANWQVVEERTAANVDPTLPRRSLSSPDDLAHAVAGAKTTTRYVWDLRYIDSPVVRLRDANGDAGQENSDGLEETLYYTTDANMNVTALVAASGAVVERYAF